MVINSVALNIEPCNGYSKKCVNLKTIPKWRIQDNTENIDETLIRIWGLDKNNNSVCGITLSACRIKMLLRWKNGVAYPGFQIS